VDTGRTEMQKKTCYHYDVAETGDCPKCATFIVVEPARRITVEMGSEGKINGSFDRVGYAPTVRDALALAFNVTEEAIVLVDVRPSGEYWERANSVTFRFAGSRVDLTATVKINEATSKSPERVEYTEEDAS
jgi:hypothetical protein